MIHLLLITLTILFCASTVSANEIYVNTTGNDTTGNGTAENPYLTIQQGMTNVEPNGTIRIANGQYSGENNTNLIINKNMTIIGESQEKTIINGTDTNGIFQIQRGITVTIENLTLSNGHKLITGYYTEAQGGAILNLGNLTVTNCTFTNNYAHSPSWSYYVVFGGAISNSNDGPDSVTCTVTGCNFTNNTADDGGAISNLNSGEGSVTCTVTGCNFTNNTALNGGAIENYCYLGKGLNLATGSVTCTVTGCNFTNNTASSGGSIENNCIAYSNSGLVTCNVRECNFNGENIYNRRYIDGGSGSVIFTANFNRFINNQATVIINQDNPTSFVDIENNWWGTNNPDFDSLISGINTPTYWLFMTINSTPSTLNNTQTTLITVSFNNHSSDGITYTTLDPNQGHIPDGTPVNFSLTNGPFGSLLPLTVYTINGTASTLFTASSVGVQTVNATTDNQNVTASITVNPSAHIQLDTFYADYNEFVNHNNIVKITDPVNYLDKVIVIITATNMGPDTITFLQLRDDWPDELVGTNQAWWRLDDTNWISEAWSPPGGSFSWWPTNVGSVKPGDTFWGVIGATVNKSNTILTNNITTINQNPVDTQDFDTKSASLRVNPAANITVTKTGPTEAIAGTTITYIITVTNNGPDPAENVQIVDNISSILQGVTHDPYNIGTIPSGESRTITIKGTIPSNTTKGTLIQNNATATTNTPGTITPSLMVITTVDTQADLNLTQSVDNNRPNVGDTVTYTVTIHNNGPSDATNIQIQDIMPSEFTNTNIIPSKGTYDPRTKIWTLNLTSGETATLNLTGKVTAIMMGKNTTNTATLVGTINQTNATIYVPKADLYVQITSDKNNPTVGETFTLRYKLGNNGPDTANNVTITIPLPEGFVISKIEGDGNWTVTGNTITWTMNNVTVGDPNLYITGWTTGIGNRLFTASITSDTFSTNSRGLSPLTLNTQPTVNAATTTSTTSGNTVGMQGTGMPLAGIVLAIIMVFGGLISTRKKQ